MPISILTVLAITVPCLFAVPPLDQRWVDFNRNNQKDLYEDRSQPLERRVEDLLKQMTLEEKIGQLHQVKFRKAKGDDEQKMSTSLLRGEVGAFIWSSPQVAVLNRFQHLAVEQSRLGIPILFGEDIVHGASTLFPIPLGLSCSFEPELFERVQAIAAKEARAEGLRWVFAPMCDIARDPRWGRVAETMGEDPYLSALCTAAQVRGLQGTDPSGADRVAACLKHYIGYGAVTGGRDKNDTEVTEWTLRNVHLPPFRAGINAGALTIMSAFNTVDGIPAAASRHALTDILRNEMKFRGFVVTDYGTVKQLVDWGFATDVAEATGLAINAGNDMDMGSGSFRKNLAAEIAAGHVSLATLDEAVRRVLRVKFQLGLFEDPYVNEQNYKSAQRTPEALALAREAVTKSTVLLKNDGVLPLRKEVRNIALIGPLGDDPLEILGCWRGRCYSGDTTLARAFREKLPVGGKLAVVKGCDISTQPRTDTLQDGSVVIDESLGAVSGDMQIDAAVQAARESEVVIMALGEPRGWSGENASRLSLSLSGNQQALFDAVVATGKPVITIVFSGRPLSLPTVWEKSAAVFYAWHTGDQGGPGLADLLWGEVSPSARLSMSVLRDVGQAPNFYNYMRTGYRNFTFRDFQGTPAAAFWFGYGLTYTTFDYSPVRIEPSKQGKPAVAAVTLTNTGDREGTEVVQLYISQLACREGARPVQELRGFKRVTLQPGQKTEVSFPLTSEVLGYFDRQGKQRADSGDYEIYIAPQSHQGAPVKFNFQP